MTGGRYRGGGAQKGIKVRGLSVIRNFAKLKSEAKAVLLGVEPIRPPVVVLGGRSDGFQVQPRRGGLKAMAVLTTGGKVVVPSVWWGEVQMDCQMQGGQRVPPNSPNYGIISYRAEPLDPGS